MKSEVMTELMNNLAGNLIDVAVQKSISSMAVLSSFGTKQKSSEMTSFPETQAATSKRLLMNRF